MSTPAVNINKVCLSGLNTIYLADQMIATGEADIVIAGGMESMTNAPYLAAGARSGFRYGHTQLQDAIITDGLMCAFDHGVMGEGTDRYAAEQSISRDAQDEFALHSNLRAAAAIEQGRLRAEITPVSIPQRKGDPIKFEHDEGVRANTTRESLASLKPAFVNDGTITAANASQISDGASALVMMSERAVNAHHAQPLGQVVAYGMVAGPDTSLLLQPSRAIHQALTKADLKVDDIDLFELNEAFAAVGVASIADLGVSSEITNVNGGAIALGHPIGASGNRLALTLLHELRRRGGGHGAAALCGGGGQGDALIVRSL